MKLSEREPEHTGPIWKHPYMIYVLLTVVLFLFLVVVGLVAFKSGIIPSRGAGA